MSVHDNWLKGLAQMPKDLKLPPPSFIELKLEFLEIEPGQKLVARLPYQERFSNPVGTYQGGYLSAGMDDVFGPLSYMTAKGPCMTLTLNVTFLKPFTPEMRECVITAWVLKDSKNFIFMRAEVNSPTGDLLAHAESHVNKVKP